MTTIITITIVTIESPFQMIVSTPQARWIIACLCSQLEMKNQSRERQYPKLTLKHWFHTSSSPHHRITFLSTRSCTLPLHLVFSNQQKMCVPILYLHLFDADTSVIALDTLYCSVNILIDWLIWIYSFMLRSTCSAPIETFRSSVLSAYSNST